MCKSVQRTSSLLEGQWNHAATVIAMQRRSLTCAPRHHPHRRTPFRRSSRVLHTGTRHIPQRSNKQPWPFRRPPSSLHSPHTSLLAAAPSTLRNSLTLQRHRTTSPTPRPENRRKQRHYVPRIRQTHHDPHSYSQLRRTVSQQHPFLCRSHKIAAQLYSRAAASLAVCDARGGIAQR